MKHESHTDGFAFGRAFAASFFRVAAALIDNPRVPLLRYAASVAFRVLFLAAASVHAGSVLPNGGFEWVESAGDGIVLPRTWEAERQGDGLVAVVEGRDKAHRGEHALCLAAGTGRAVVRYAAIPLADPATWQGSVWVRGQGELAVTLSVQDGNAWKPCFTKTVKAERDWREVAFNCVPPPAAPVLRLELAGTGGPFDLCLDDVTLGHPGLPTLNLPPAAALSPDAATLLHLPFETPLDEFAFFTRGQVSLADSGQFGKALEQRADAYVAGSADDFLDARQGTIEVWVRLLSPGDDRVARPFVSVPGPAGLWLGKDQYSHIGFGLSSNWGQGSSVTAMGYAWNWQPGVWRHVTACWDRALLQLWVDGRLLGSAKAKNMPRMLGPELRLGAPGLVLDDLRISKTVRYRVPVRLGE